MLRLGYQDLTCGLAGCRHVHKLLHSHYVVSMLSLCYHHIASMLPVCNHLVASMRLAHCYPVACMWLACYKHVAGMFPAYPHHVANTLLACCNHIVGIFPAYHWHFISNMPACHEHVARMWSACGHLDACMLPAKLACCPHIARYHEFTAYLTMLYLCLGTKVPLVLLQKTHGSILIITFIFLQN